MPFLETNTNYHVIKARSANTNKWKKCYADGQAGTTDLMQGSRMPYPLGHGHIVIERQQFKCKN